MHSDVPSIRFVKLSAKIVSPYLSILYNKCVEYGMSPGPLKFAEVIPIYKSSIKITLITTNLILFYPHLKKNDILVCERLKKLSLLNEVLNEKQNGFRENSTT